jgi:hypothetical protein
MLASPYAPAVETAKLFRAVGGSASANGSARGPRDNPLPERAGDAGKHKRGRVFAIGGCRTLPGGIRLIAEAALRAGAPARLSGARTARPCAGPDARGLSYFPHP